MPDEPLPSAVIDSATVARTNDGVQFHLSVQTGPAIQLERADGPPYQKTMMTAGELLDRLKTGALYIPDGDDGLQNALRDIAED